MSTHKLKSYKSNYNLSPESCASPSSKAISQPVIGLAGTSISTTSIFNSGRSGAALLTKSARIFESPLGEGKGKIFVKDNKGKGKSCDDGSGKGLKVQCALPEPGCQ